ncbi:hypothetical protein EHO58_01560 [Leptospira selangorensis]|uniref:hypothetical protein n=1 Tax=Leptospira selangorensis TaxID=2484982 RepID=UPI0010833BF6|nr:hypothetical protein [Leptospira selangorensis]TGK10137.1 hypothetical protein EHO58_01560 [Leptospira selangorensis]
MKIKKEQKLFAIIGILVAIYISILLSGNVPLIKFITLTGRFIFPPLDTTVYLDDKLERDVRVFAINSIYDPFRFEKHDQPVNAIVVWIPDLDSPYERTIIYINLDRMIAGDVNLSKKEYDLFFSWILFQSDNGQYVVPWQDGVKGRGFDPNLRIIGKDIIFNLPIGYLGNVNSIKIVKN